MSSSSVVTGCFPNSIFHDTVKKEELITEFYLYLREDDWHRLRQFGFRSKLETWLTVVAIRFFKEKTTSRTNLVKLDTLLDEVQQVADKYDPVETMSKLELYEAIDRHLKPRERFALLGWLSGEKSETIAKELSCSVMAVYNLVKKAKVSVKKKMKGNEK